MPIALSLALCVYSSYTAPLVSVLDGNRHAPLCGETFEFSPRLSVRLLKFVRHFIKRLSQGGIAAWPKPNTPKQLLHTRERNVGRWRLFRRQQSRAGTPGLIQPTSEALHRCRNVNGKHSRPQPWHPPPANSALPVLQKTHIFLCACNKRLTCRVRHNNQRATTPSPHPSQDQNCFSLPFSCSPSCINFSSSFPHEVPASFSRQVAAPLSPIRRKTCSAKS